VHHCTFSTSTTNNNIINNDSEPGKFAMPDQDMELKLVQIQTTVSQHYQRGDYSKALALSKDLFQQSQKHFGQDHPAVASALNNVGLMQKQLGDFIEARRHYNAALRIYAKVVGRDHASYAMTLHNLASLNKAQVHFDTSLKATERLSLVETALDYFEEALAIRRVELGPDHPLTIATQSSLGTTLADQVLNQHRQVKDGQHKYVSLNPEAVTQQGWEAAEHHLRQAVQMAISKPRGKSINNKNNKVKKGMKKAAAGTKLAPSSSLAASPITNEDSSSS
jgi:tetratricopeptide (TPR) repeat protein